MFKRFLPVLVLFFIFQTNVFALATGSYVTYHDTRNGWDMFRSYWVLPVEDGTITFFIRSVDYGRSREHNLAVQGYFNSSGNWEILEVIGKTQGVPDRFIQALDDLAFFCELNGEINDLNSPNPREVEKTRDGERVFIIFRRFFPLFGFESIRSASETFPSYRLTTTGYIPPDNQKEFFSLPTLFPDTASIESDISISPGFPRVLSMGEYRFTGDFFWRVESSSSGSRAILSLRGPQDGIITIESLPRNELEANGIFSLEQFLQRSLFLGRNQVLLNTYEEQYKDGGILISYLILEKAGVCSFINFFVWYTEDKLMIRNFSGFAEIVLGNRDYFDSILNSFQLIDRG